MKKRRSGLSEGKRTKVRLISKSSIQSKRYEPVHDWPKKVRASRVHPQVVLTDLRKGCLDSLDKYLRQERGIRDREIVLELRKLIGGSHYRSDYRLIVVEHPERPAAKGGAPKKDGRPPAMAFKIAEKFWARRQKGQVESLVAELAEEFSCKINTVYKYVRMVEVYEEAIRAEEEGRKMTASLAQSLTFNQWVRIIASSRKKTP